MNPAMATRSISWRSGGVDQPLGVGQPVEVGPNVSRSTSSTGIPAPSATSTARHGRSTTTTPTGRAAAISDSRIVPLPDANTPIRRTLASYPRAALRHAILQARERDGELPPTWCPVRHHSFRRRPITVEKNLKPGEIVVMAGAGLALIFSFLPFYKIEDVDLKDGTSAAPGLPHRDAHPDLRGHRGRARRAGSVRQRAIPAERLPRLLLEHVARGADVLRRDTRGRISDRRQRARRRARLRILVRVDRSRRVAGRRRRHDERGANEGVIRPFKRRYLAVCGD